MGAELGKLTFLAVRNAKPGRHGDGAGLYLLVAPSGSRSWVLRVQQMGRRRDIGLGSIAALTLAEARERAAKLRKAALNGLDPIAERDGERRIIPTFKAAVTETHRALEDGWIPKNAAAFLKSLEDYAVPTLGKLRVDTIEASHIRDTLAPIWTAKPELARKVRMRIGQVLNFSHSKGWRPSEAPTKAVTLGLPKQPKGRNFSAMPYDQVPAFVAETRAKAPTDGRRALLLLIFTAARPGEVRLARWGQIDFATATWNRPAEIMKLRQPHTVTLSAAAVELLRTLERTEAPGTGDLLFAGRKGQPLSDMALNKVLRDANIAYDTHGFRSSFRDWAAEQMPHIPDPVAEAALSHMVADKVVRAYKRTTFLTMRRELLDSWGRFVSSAPQVASTH